MDADEPDDYLETRSPNVNARITRVRPDTDGLKLCGVGSVPGERDASQITSTEVPSSLSLSGSGYHILFDPGAAG